MTAPSHFWLLTLQKQDEAGQVDQFTVHGTLTPGPGATRMDVYTTLREQVIAAHPGYENAGVLAFDLQSNTI